ncbi:unnamed protein product [Urochloa humidicola]
MPPSGARWPDPDSRGPLPRFLWSPSPTRPHQRRPQDLRGSPQIDAAARTLQIPSSRLGSERRFRPRNRRIPSCSTAAPTPTPHRLQRQPRPRNRRILNSTPTNESNAAASHRHLRPYQPPPTPTSSRPPSAGPPEPNLSGSSQDPPRQIYSNSPCRSCSNSVLAHQAHVIPWIVNI